VTIRSPTRRQKISAAAPRKRGTQTERAKASTVAVSKIRGIAVLGKAMSVLNLVADGPRPFNFAGLLKSSGLPKATLHRILSALGQYGLLRVDESDRTYRLGFRVFELAHKVWADFDLRSAAETELARLWQQTGETVQLGVASNDHIVLIDQRESMHQLKFTTEMGKHHAIHTTAIGKAIFAFMHPVEQTVLLLRLPLEAATTRSISDRRTLESQLQLTRTRGYALEIEENTEGASAVAAPILDPTGKPLGAIALSGPTIRLSEERLHELGAELIASARRIARSSGVTVASVEPLPNPILARSVVASSRGAKRDEVRCVLPASAMLGEGPLWCEAEHSLYWLDIVAPALHRFDPSTGGNDTFSMPSMVGAAALRRGGGLVLGLQSGIVMFDPSTGAVTPYAHHDLDRPETRYNDGKCDARGRLWISTLDTAPKPGSGCLFRLNASGRMDCIDRGFTVPNGMAFSPDNRVMYFADSGQRVIFRFDFDLESGTARNRRIFIEVPNTDGTPDGMTIDSKGGLWVAHWDGWCVRRYTPDGRIDRTLPLSVPRPTSVAFGGPGLQTLFITTARLRLPTRTLAEAPLSGSLFAIETGFGGLPEPAFREGS
jgi:sugar lactone lactonase YvrE/DNA-binding IclR family transcriptional regulator